MNIQESNSDWVMEEFRNFHIEDPRLIERFFITAQLLASKPLDCINKACGSWSAAKGTYRLLSNNKLKPEDIFECHQSQTIRRISEHKLVFAIQDTCFLDYENHPKTKGLGSISRGYGKDKPGLIMHPTYIITDKALPLGILTWQSWARPLKPTRTTYEKVMENYHREAEDKESYKWIEALQQSTEIIPDSIKVVTLADREADIFEFMHEHNKIGRSFVIRNRFNRRLTKTKYKNDPKMRDVLAQKDPCGVTTIELPAQRGRPARKAKLAIRSGSFTTPLRSNLKGGASGNKDLPTVLAYNIVHAVEIDPPNKEDQIDWYLVTNEDVSTFEQAVEKLNWYKLRWQIETFFRTLKSGCRIESARLADADRIYKYNILMAIVAWRICFMTHAARLNPEAPCTEIMDEDHWQALHLRVNKTALPKKPPNVGQVVNWIAQLGGFLNRKSDGEPGSMTIWKGWQILEEILPLYITLKNQRPP